MEVLVLVDFEGTTEDELAVRVGDVVNNVTVSSENGWLEGELRGKKGIFPANFVKEVPLSLLGDNQRQPRSLRKSTMLKPQCRKCEVTYAYTPLHKDELLLVAGETIEVLKEIEDGWWMGEKNGKIGAFPSNFVKEIFVTPKDTRINKGKSRPKLADAVLSKEGMEQQRASIRKKTNGSSLCDLIPRSTGSACDESHTFTVKESCKVMFDYSACAEDELDLKKGEIIIIINKLSEDDGWWEGELNGRRGFFPDNFVMLIPNEALQEKKQPPLRSGSQKHPDEKAQTKDLRSDPPGKFKLPGMVIASPPPVKDKPPKFVIKSNDDQAPASTKHIDSKLKESDQFDGVDMSSAKLSHPTANRAKPPQRRPPTGTGSHASTGTNESVTTAEAEGDKKAKENYSPSKNEVSPSPQQPSKTKVQQEEPSLEHVQAELKELRMALELFKTQHETEMKELKDELQEERNKRMKLQDEVQVLKKQK